MYIDLRLFGHSYTPLEFTCILLGGAIALLLASAISRMAYYTYKSHLLTREMQADIRKLVILHLQNAVRFPDPHETEAAPHDITKEPPQPPGQ
jgi:hypothetical protein